MSSVKAILVPTDFSACADAAMDVAADLAKDLGARIELLHVFQVPYLTGWEDGTGSGAGAAIAIDAWRKDIAKQLAERVARLKARGLDATASDVDGAPHHQIAERSAGVDLIVIGTHGRTGLPRVVLGSVAERVVRLARCPVLAVPAKA